MSNILLIADIAPTWQQPLLLSILIFSLILWVSWFVKVLINGGLLRGAPQITCHPDFPEVALTVISIVLLTTLLAWLLQGLLNSANLETSLAGSLANLLTCSLILALMRRQRPRGLSCLGFGSRHWARQLAWGLLAGLAAWPVAVFLLSPISLYLVRFLAQWGWGLSYTPEDHTLLREMIDSPGTAESVLIVLMALLVAPLTEEIIFRGLLQNALVGLFRSRWTAIVLAALVFSVLHIASRDNPAAGQVPLTQIESVLPLFFLGLVLGYAYEKSRSIYRPIALHFIFNALTVLMSFPNSS